MPVPYLVELSVCGSGEYRPCGGQLRTVNVQQRLQHTAKRRLDAVCNRSNARARVGNVLQAGRDHAASGRLQCTVTLGMGAVVRIRTALGCDGTKPERPPSPFGKVALRFL